MSGLFLFTTFFSGADLENMGGSNKVLDLRAGNSASYPISYQVNVLMVAYRPRKANGNVIKPSRSIKDGQPSPLFDNFIQSVGYGSLPRVSHTGGWSSNQWLLI